MISDAYIPRTLLHKGNELTEDVALAQASVIVVLGEPGAGKTELLNSFAARLGVSRIKASLFRYSTAFLGCRFLILDALDEVAKLDPSGIDALLVKAHEAKASLVIFASRSSEWEEARNKQIRACFGVEPFVVRLSPFDLQEQRKLFYSYVPDEDFEKFKGQTDRFDLGALLGNPQFLKLFADAYVESGYIFTSKQKIFEDAVRRLAHEANDEVTQKGGATTLERISWAGEIFAKLLLSGADGVGTTDSLLERQFPHIRTLVAQNINAESVIGTRLFKPSEYVGQHEPVHRIVAEYCAAGYLVRRIEDGADPLSLAQCLAVIAPNAVVRDELRGLLGWMASLGNKRVQEAAIDLDPYTVLANGDPSQLLASSKQRLLSGLQRTAENDPLFRRSDIWRTFSASGFFEPEVVGDLKALLSRDEEEGQLKGLILELLEGSPATSMLVPELRLLMLDPSGMTSIRILAHRCIIDLADHDHLSDVKALLDEGSADSLTIAANMYEKLGMSCLGLENILILLRKYAALRQSHRDHEKRIIGGSYFIKTLLQSLHLADVIWLLDRLTCELECRCGADKYRCQCRDSRSKIVGKLLDVYFERAAEPHEPEKIWKWVRNLHFDAPLAPTHSAAVQALQADNKLRRGIHRLVLGELTDPDKAWETRINAFDHYSHSGLCFLPDDRREIVDFAFATENPGLWSSFIPSHNVWCAKEQVGPDALRSHMREQAMAKQEFGRFWAKHERAARLSRRKALESRDWFSRRRKRRENKIFTFNAESLAKNRELVEKGEHWGWLRLFSREYLFRPENLASMVDDPSLPERSLRNCLHFIAPHVASLTELAEYHASSEIHDVQVIVYAACLAIFRREQGLPGVGREVLEALKADADLFYPGSDASERNALENEINQRLFTSSDAAENFLRNYIEPQLKGGNCSRSQVGWLLYKEEFSKIKRKMAFEWLSRFPAIWGMSLEVLFDVCVREGDIDDIRRLIALRCAEIFFFYPDRTDNQDLENLRAQWLVRNFYFLNEGQGHFWKFLLSDKESIFALKSRSGRLSQMREKVGWPRLSAAKVYHIMDAYVDQWPRVLLPEIFGTGSPKGEEAYRFLRDVVWAIEEDDPDDSVPILNIMLSSPRFDNFRLDLQSMRASTLRKKALRDFEPPAPHNVADLLDRGTIATVEGLRALLVEEFSNLQDAIYGGEFDTLEVFYEAGRHVGEVVASKRIAERIDLRLNAFNISIAIEHQLKDAKRCDITASKMIDGARRLIVIEVKGQWHRELFIAAAAQLYERYAIHPNAEQQGIYLVLWVGAGELIAGTKNHAITSPNQLRERIIESIPELLRGRIDVVVLDLEMNSHRS